MLKFLRNWRKKRRFKKSIRLTTPDGYIEIVGRDDFPLRIWLDISENSPEVRSILNGAFGDVQSVRAFETENIWDDLITDFRNE